MKRLMAMLAGVAAMAAFAAGCGSGDDSEPLTKAEFIKQGDAICKKGFQEVRKEFEAFSKRENTQKTGVNKQQGKEIGLQIVLPNTQKEAEELRELEPPEADQEEITAMLDALESGVEKGEQNPDSLFSTTNYPLDEANKMAKAYGFKLCGIG